MSDSGAPEVSVVIPLFDEEESLKELYSRLKEMFEENNKSFELLFINDGSQDGSAAILDQLAQEDPRVGVVHFRRNFGKAAALDAGFKRAAGAVVVTMDADLQDDPKEIPRFLEQIDAGFDLVSGWKKKRHDPLGKTLPSKFFNYTVSRVSGLKLKDFNCGFKAYRAEAVEDLHLYGELHRFVPVLVYWRGFSVTQITVEHHARQFGKSKYGVERMVKGAFDLLTVLLMTRFRTRPLHLFGGLGVLTATIGLVPLLYLTAVWALHLGTIQRPLLFFGLLCVMVGVQLVSTGLLGEMINAARPANELGYKIRGTMLPRASTPLRLADAQGATSKGPLVPKGASKEATESVARQER